MKAKRRSEGGAYVVVGATGTVGRAVIAELEHAGLEVNGVARGVGVSIDDQPRLNRAFEGARGAFVMIPFDMAASDLHQREDEISDRLATAVASARVPRVVLLSGLNAPLKRGTSLGAARMETRLDALGIPELVHLRAGFFMENLTRGLSFAAQAQAGVFRTPFRGDRPIPMVAAADVGRFSARLLLESPWDRARVVELGGEKRSMVAATTILGAALGRTDIRYEQLSPDAARAAMVQAGMPPSFVEAVLQTADSFNRGDAWGSDSVAPRGMELTPIATWAERALAEAAS